MSKVLKLALIGVGPHCKRVYLPSIQKLVSSGEIELVLVVELSEKESATVALLKHFDLETNSFFIKGFSGSMPKDVQRHLDDKVFSLGIDAVIIATEPLVHVAYSRWALKNKLHVLVDKPLSTYPFIAHNPTTAKALFDDLLELLTLQRVNTDSRFIINAQRRYHPGFNLVMDKIKNIKDNFQCPITSLQSMHCDGQWRLPMEIVTQDYHPYNVGYGKVSHSGYHIIDIVSELYKSSLPLDKLPTAQEIFASFVYPTGLLKQLTREDYINVFGNDYNDLVPFGDETLHDIFSYFGEVDAHINVGLVSEDTRISNLSIALLHNGFARRDWLFPGTDLYKGNGRVKHEYYNIQQGPFQNIQIHSYQSNDNHSSSNKTDYALGGNNHFDIHVFRNNRVTGDVMPLETFTMQDIANNYSYDDSKLVSEQLKQSILPEFLNLVRNRSVSSNLELHTYANTILLMSSVYESSRRLNEGVNPIVNVPFLYDDSNLPPSFNPFS